MTPQEEQLILNLQTQLDSEQLRRLEAQNINSKMSLMGSSNDQSIATQQLDLKEEIDRLYHLINGHTIEKDGKGGEYWVEPKDERLKTLTEYGAKQVIKYILFYLNKNVLLSNFTEEEIYNKLKDFGEELADFIYSDYENFFYYLTPEEYHQKYKQFIDGTTINEENFYAKCIEWSEDELRRKAQELGILILAVLDSIHATFKRALNGEERESLRKQLMIHQNLNSQSQTPTPDKSRWNIFK